jgi:hypothetical protein
MTAPSDPTALVAELRLALTRDQYCDGTEISHSVASGLLALIAQQTASIEALTKERDEARRLRDYWLYQHDQLVEEVHQLQDAVEGHEAGKVLAAALAPYGFPMSDEAWRNTGDDAPVNSQASVEARALHRAATAYLRSIAGGFDVGE